MLCESATILRYTYITDLVFTIVIEMKIQLCHHHTHISNQNEFSSQGKEFLCLGSGNAKLTNSALYRLY
jgi:hypothetical protein